MYYNSSKVKAQVLKAKQAYQIYAMSCGIGIGDFVKVIDTLSDKSGAFNTPFNTTCKEFFKYKVFCVQKIYSGGEFSLSGGFVLPAICLRLVDLDVETGYTLV